MKVSDVLAHMGIEAVVRGDIEYSDDLDISSLNIDYPNDDAPTNEQFHAAANSALKQNKIREYSRALQNYIDNIAREKNYENGFTCATYVNSTNEAWKQEAQTFVAWRDACWLYAYNVYNQVENGIIPAPTLESFLSDIPAFNWS